MIELILLIAGVAMVESERRAGVFPRPLIRELQHGTTAERVEALRHLCLFGRGGSEAIPSLIDRLRDDPSPVVRRGAATVLSMLATAPRADEWFTIEQLLSGRPSKPTVDEDRTQSPAPAQPRAEEVAEALSRSLRSDLDGTVRRESIRALGTMLEETTGLRPPPDRFDQPWRYRVEPPESTTERIPTPIVPWMEPAAESIAEAAGSSDVMIAQTASTWLFDSPAAWRILGEDRIFEAMLACSQTTIDRERDSPTGLLIVKAAALMARPDRSRRSALVTVLAPAMAEDDPAAEPIEGDRIRTLYILASPTAEELGRHPEVIEALIRAMQAPDRYDLWTDLPQSNRVIKRALSRYSDDLTDNLFWFVIHRLAADVDALALVWDRLRQHGCAPLFDETLWEEIEPSILGADAAWLSAIDSADAARGIAMLLDADGRCDGTASPLYRRQSLTIAARLARSADADDPAVGRLKRRIAALLLDPWPEARDFGGRLASSLDGFDRDGG